MRSLDPVFEAQAKNAGRLEDLGVVILDCLRTATLQSEKKMFGIVSGPISTGGVGNVKGNLKIFSATIHKLECLGIQLFDQVPFEKHMARIVKSSGKDYDPMKLLEGCYLPLFNSGLIGTVYLIHGWKNSFGASWESKICSGLDIPRVFLPKSFHNLAIRRSG